MDTLTLEHISYQYKKADREVLKDVNCRFSSGEMAAVIGPSGSGKTTFLSILAGLDMPTSGTIRMDGQGSVAAQGSGCDLPVFPAVSAADGVRECHVSFGTEWDVRKRGSQRGES